MTAQRLAWMAAVVLGYLLLCAVVVLRHRQRRARAQREAAALAADAAADQPPVLVVHASETGQAEALAWQTARALHAGGVAARLLPLAALDAATLAGSRRLLLLASTSGEGDPPDAAVGFVQHVMRAEPTLPLPSLQYAVLALGDRRYARFCAFGRALDDWLQRAGAQALFERIDVDAGDHLALGAWARQVAALGLQPAPEALPLAADGPPESATTDWRLVQRRCVNPGSSSAPLYLLSFEAVCTAPHTWQAGDLVQLCPPGDAHRARSYSIASVPGQGPLALLVRLQRRQDGSAGLASGWLCEQLPVGQAVPLRVLPYARFRIGDNAGRPLVLVGHGSGMAGLRAHLQARAQQGAAAVPVWLVFGDRHAAHDLWMADELRAWQASGLLRELDLVWSADTPGQPHVQHRLRERQHLLWQWMADGAALYVCGSVPMAQAVDALLHEGVGAATVQGWRAQGRYRVDAY